MLTIQIVIALIVGILLAEIDSAYIPCVLLCVTAVAVIWFKSKKQPVLFVAIVAIGNLLAIQDKAWDNRGAEDGLLCETRSAIMGFIEKRTDELKLSPVAGPLVHGMLLADRSRLGRDLTENIRLAGMSHFLAVSGLHIGIIYVIFFIILFPLRWLGHHKVHRILANLIVWLYVFLIAFPPSAVRAALMLSLNDYTWIQKYHVSWRTLLASSSLILLLYDTQLLWNVSFQLSFIATSGIILPKNLLIKNKLTRMLVISIYAHLVTTPIVAYYFHSVPVFGWVQGVLVAPMLPWFLCFSMLYILFPSAHLLSYPIEMIVSWMNFAADKIVAVETWCLGGRLAWSPSLIETCLLEALLFFALYFISNHRRQHAARRKNILSP